jgi:hypothetical protein
MFVKLPQILRFVAAGSVAGISRGSTYLELLGYLLGSVYHLVQVRGRGRGKGEGEGGGREKRAPSRPPRERVRPRERRHRRERASKPHHQPPPFHCHTTTHHNPLCLLQGTPWSAYGETVIVTVQSALIVVMLWVYDPPGALHIAAVSGGFAAAAQFAYAAPPQYRALVMQSTTLLFIASRSWQIIANARARSTGELAFLTLFMNAAGAAARIFTSLQEVKQVSAQRKGGGGARGAP